MTPSWDLNADLGEGDPVMDGLLLGIVTSANVACGGHAGDNETMRRICDVAAARGVAIGAQVSYVDPEGFGRRRLDVGPEVLASQIADQLGALAEHADAAGTSVTYVKPHGALYHAAVSDAVVAEAVLQGVAGLPVLTLPFGALRDAAQARGVEVYTEAFADRGYTCDGRLVPRSDPRALLESAGAVSERIQRLVAEGVIVSIDGSAIPIEARSICVHSDTPGANALAALVRDHLEAAGVRLEPFAPPRAGT
ncbi:MAG: LamB/YcsF family protein [Candidatus Nanopelagicales bacterium]